MTTRRAPIALAVVIWASLIAFAFLTTSADCDWRLAAYLIAAADVRILCRLF